ncbi:MAG: hypothetical protein HY903_10235 [Deltaproteobacteria bacterium]|nr:hypothetical protein [Deltaproteobacteria bacterium]
MSKRFICVGLMLAVGCGDASPTAVAATVRLDALLKDQVRSLSVYVLGPRRTDGIFLTCSNLMDRAMAPDDSRVEALGGQDIAFTDPAGRALDIANVEPGDNRLVYGEAFDAGGTAIANGCTDSVTVAAGSTVEVQLYLYPL